MQDAEGQWSKALANNNIRAIIRWLRSLPAEGDIDVEENLDTFSCWVQRTSEFAKKELLTLCFSRCQGLWMFLDQSSFTRVHLLLQKLRNLLTLAQWGRRQLSSAHLWHGVGVPCVVCREIRGSSEIRSGCWNREHRALEQHIWLGRLVQWWGITGLLSKHPEAHEVRRISQMWREMDHSHQKTCLETSGWEEGGAERLSSFIQGMVAQLDKQHGSIWTSEDNTEQCYPPPNLQALLKLVLVPHIDNMSVQAVLMYFVLDMASFLQCKDDLLQSFCHAFTIPPSFSQQIRAFWMHDHGQVKASVELLLSPRAAVPWLSWQHRCIIHSLLTRKQHRMAFWYIHSTRPAIESPQDVKLCADVLLQNSCVSEAWALLRKVHTESEDMVNDFLQACKELGLRAEALKYIPESYNDEDHNGVNSETDNMPMMRKLSVKTEGRPPCPLSAQLYQSHSFKTVSSEDLVKLHRKAVLQLKKPHPRISEEVAWPVHRERNCSSRDLCPSTKALRHLPPSTSPVDVAGGTEHLAHTEEPEEEQSRVYNMQPETLECVSLECPSTEALSSDSISSFTSASSLPPLKSGRPYVYESTLTLQKISAFLTDGENQSRVEEESRAPSAGSDTPPGCPDLAETVDGTIDPLSFNSLNKDSVEELVLSAEWCEEELPREDLLTVDRVAGPSMDKDLLLDKRSRGRLNLPPQFYSNEDNQSVPSLFEPQVESHNFHSPDYEKMGYVKRVSVEVIHGPPNVADPWSTALLKNQEEDQPECVPHQMFSFSEATTSQCFLELEPLQRACEPPQQEESVECFHQDSQDAVDQPEILTCALSQTTQALLAELHRGLLLEEPRTTARGSDEVKGSAGMGKQDSAGTPPGRYRRPPSLQDCSLLMPQPVCPTQIPGGPLSPRTSPTCSSQIDSASSGAARGRSPEASAKKEAASFQRTSDRLDHGTLDSWWKQALETHRGPTGLLPALEQVLADTSEKRTSPARPCSHSLLDVMESSTKQKGKQADKEEPAGHRFSGNTPHQRAKQGATGQRRSRPRTGKRVKNA